MQENQNYQEEFEKLEKMLLEQPEARENEVEEQKGLLENQDSEDQDEANQDSEGQESEDQEQAEPDEETKDYAAERLKEKLRERREIKKRNYHLQHQVKSLEAKNRELIQQLEDSNFLGTEHYVESAQLKLLATKEKMKEALEAGNADEYIDLQEELYKCTHEINQAKFLKENNERNRLQEKKYQPVVEQAEDNLQATQQEIISDWLKDHPEINPDSKKFNKKLYRQIYDYASDLNEELSLSGREDLYLSANYLRNLDNKLEKLKRNSYSSPAVGGVRNSFAPKISQNKIVLTAAEKEFCKSSNGVISERDFLEQKIDELNRGIK